jgi:hypothetical protein
VIVKLVDPGEHGHNNEALPRLELERLPGQGTFNVRKLFEEEANALALRDVVLVREQDGLVVEVVKLTLARELHPLTSRDGFV